MTEETTALADACAAAYAKLNELRVSILSRKPADVTRDEYVEAFAADRAAGDLSLRLLVALGGGQNMDVLIMRMRSCRTAAEERRTPDSQETA